MTTLPETIARDRAATEAPPVKRRRVREIRGNVGELLDDIVTLAELQFKLLVVDARATARGWIGPAAMLGGGLVLVLGAAPVFLTGVGWLLVELAGWSVGAALLTVAVIAAIAGALLLVGAGLLLRKSADAFERSRTEFAENVRWVRAAFRRTQPDEDSTSSRGMGP